MVFVFDRPDLDIAGNVRRTAREEYDQAIAEVGETGFEVHGTVRNVRRRLKRIRSLLRLIRPVFADFAAENAALRDIGAEVSGLRDVQALVEAADRLGQRAPPSAVAAMARLRGRLTQRAAAHESALDREAFLIELRAALREARVRSELWELADTGPRALVPGFVATYRGARRAFRAAAGSPGDDALFHEWRKQLKYHWGHLKVLRGLVPAFADGRRRCAGQLSAILGDVQNLCVLRDNLELAADDRPAIECLLEPRLDKLKRKALRIGKGLFAERPAIVSRRWRMYFEDWQASETLGGRR